MQISWFGQVVQVAVGGGVWFAGAYFILGRIFRKAGFSPWMGLVAAMPGINIAVVVWFAFADWPNVPGPFGTMNRPH